MPKPAVPLTIRYSLEYALFGLSEAVRSTVINDTRDALLSRTTEGTEITLDSGRVLQGGVYAFCEVNNFLSKADGDQIFSVLRQRAAAIGATNYGRAQSYIRLTEEDPHLRTLLTRRTTSPDWADDPGTLTNL